MDSVVLRSRQLLNLEPAPQKSHPVTLSRVLWIKMLRWLDQASAQAILKALRRLATLLLVFFLVAAPQATLGFLTSAAKWNSFRIPLFCVVLFLTLNARRGFFYLRRFRRRTNQHTYHGLPVGEFASFLKTHESFKFADAKRLALSQGQYRKIAEELEKNGVLLRGKDNARILRPISFEDLVRQLRDNFPMMWDEIHNEWTEKNDAYARYLRDRAFQTRKLTEDVERKERKLARLEKNIKRAQPIFASIQV